jgi:hypothetical protein
LGTVYGICDLNSELAQMVSDPMGSPEQKLTNAIAHLKNTFSGSSEQLTLQRKIDASIEDYLHAYRIEANGSRSHFSLVHLVENSLKSKPGVIGLNELSRCLEGFQKLSGKTPNQLLDLLFDIKDIRPEADRSIFSPVPLNETFLKAAQLIHESHVGPGKALLEVRQNFEHELAEKQIRIREPFNVIKKADSRGGLVFVEDGTLPLDSISGLPDASAFGAAKQATRIQLRNSELIGYQENEKELIRKLAKSLKTTIDKTYSAERNALLSKINYTEPLARGNVNISIEKLIREEEFKERDWWMNTDGDDSRTAISDPERRYQRRRGNSFRPYERPIQDRGYRRAVITGKTSKGPLKNLYGEGADRVTFWAAAKDGLHASHASDADLSSIRISINRDKTGAEKSLELLVLDNLGNPQPFFFVKMGDEWIPSLVFEENFGDRKPVEVACIRCHHVEGDHSKFSFRPIQSNTEENLMSSGYRDHEIIKQILASP